MAKMWGLCVAKGKSQRDSIKIEKSEQSNLSYDELRQSIRDNREQYKAAKEKRRGKNGAQFVDSALSFGRTVEKLLHDFPELLGPAHALDSQYGGIVLPAISLLWRLVSSKQRYEEQMQEQLESLLEQFSYLQRFKDLYLGRGDRQTDEEGIKLQELLKPVFRSIADFLDSSAAYYQSKHGHTRFRRAIVSPQGANLENVSKLILKAQDQLSFLLSMEVHDTRMTTDRIKEQCDELNAENLKIRKQLQAQNEQRITDRLSHLKRLLKLSSIDEQQQRTQFEGDLQRTFEFNKKRVPKYQDVPRICEKDPSFLTWRDSESSTVLVLSGHSSGTQKSQRFCWVSAAAMNLIKHLQESDCPVAFFNGQVGTTYINWKARSTDKEALRSMIGQVASWDPCCLQKVDYEQHIGHPDWDSDDLGRETKFLRVLLDLYSAAEPVYLVFDNLSMHDEPSTGLFKKPVLIKRFLELVRDVQGVVKILLVGLKEDFDEVGLDILRDTVVDLDRERLLYRLAWDSAKLQRTHVW